MSIVDNSIFNNGGEPPQIDNLNKDDLKALAKRLGLKVSGTVADLKKRIQAAQK